MYNKKLAKRLEELRTERTWLAPAFERSTLRGVQVIGYDGLEEPAVLFDSGELAIELGKKNITTRITF